MIIDSILNDPNDPKNATFSPKFPEHAVRVVLPLLSLLQYEASQVNMLLEQTVARIAH